MKQFNKISIGLVLLSALTIIFVWPFYKHKSSIKDLSQSIEGNIRFMKLGPSVARSPLCGPEIITDESGKIVDAKLRKLSKSEQERCESQRVEDKKIWDTIYLDLLTPKGCFDKFNEKYEAEFTSHEILNACDMATKRIKLSKAHKRRYDPRN